MKRWSGFRPQKNEVVMFRIFFAVLVLCGISGYADVKVFDYPDCRIYTILDAPNRFPATLFVSVDPQERFVQTAGDYAGSVNVFIVEFKNEKKRVMIDAGFGVRRGKLLTEMKKADITPESISDILITHIHPDHVGGLPDFPKAKIHIAQEEYEAWEKDLSRKYLAKYLPEKENLSLFAYCTEVVPDLKAIKAAGHTPGHTVFQMKDRYFVGDIVHAVDLQIAHPFFSSRYDMKPQEAAASRRKVLKEFRGEWFGAHITYPGKYRNQ